MGSHKTGTTTLQASFEKNRDLLRIAGLIYPTIDGKFSHHKWAHLLAESACCVKAREAIEITEQWLHTLQKNEALLLSSEGLYRHINNNPEYLLLLKNMFKEMEIIPVLCLRNQGAYARSLYNEWVLNWQYPHNIYRFIRDFYPWFDYENFISKLCLLGKPVLISYHQIVGVELGSKFISEIGYPLKLTAHDSYLRESPPDAHIYLKRRLNNVYPDIRHKAIVNETLKLYFSRSHPELSNSMPKLIWQGSLDPLTFERSFYLKNKRLCDQFNKNHTEFFPEKIYALGQPVDSQVFSILEDLYNDVKKELIEKIGF